jgi:hypothetical protein
MARQGKRPQIADEVFRAIVDELNKSEQVPPKGFLTRNEWAERWGLERTATSRYLSWATERGILEKIALRRRFFTQVRKVPHWGLKLPTKKKTSTRND